ncbi:MAG TPA: aminomethyl-transferring glycine dehydrogenase subunit GcvPB [Gemmatimonadales bacterium]|nr:aminomethyl-transferring glycine dehydrogenase subunit GcvPB [Gemmatimonadales bacterium]
MQPFPLSPVPTPLVFERSRSGRGGTRVPKPIAARRAADVLPAAALRKTPPRLPEVPEFEVMRHYVELSLKNHHVDRALYPLGSCTMKYNPKVNEDMARLPGFAALHPFAPDSACQGALKLIHTLGEWLKDVSGMDAITLQPAAGAQGEMTGIFLIAAYHRSRGDAARKTVIIPDSAHGTNPATAALAGFVVKAIKSDSRGQMDLATLKAALGPDTAAVMLTNPNTVGRFETEVVEIAKLVHGAGALLYMDGANMNALMGVVRPGDSGVDAMHFNLHKTFSTPHGGGGPGAGPVAVKKHLEPFLPVPLVVKAGDGYRREWDRPQSIGKLHGYFGNFGMMVRAYTYVSMLGREGIRETAQAAVLNANYLAARIESRYPLPFGRGMHECVATGTPFKERHGVRTLDIAKRLLDYGFHAPTVYFPLIVPEALMIEPTETATKDELDRFADTMLQIAKEAEEQPELVTGAPRLTPVSRFDEAAAARNPDVRYAFGK